MRYQTDVPIVGARVAGSVLAPRLGDAGFDVVMVDAATFPSPTLSTHYFRGGELVEVLDELGLLEDVLQLGPPKLPVSYIYPHSQERTVVPGKRLGRHGYHLSVRREVLDHLLVQRAERAGSVTVLQATRLRALLRDDSGVVGARFERNGQGIEVNARITVGADGRTSTVARLTGTQDTRFDPASRATYYVYVEGFRPPVSDEFDGNELSLVGDEVGYVFPSDSAITCIGVSVNLERFRAMRPRYIQAFWERLADHPHLTDRVASSRPTSEVFAFGPTPSYVRRATQPGVVLVGDAGIHLDPWTGHGMDFAGRHACFAADAIADVLRGGDEAAAFSSYYDKRDEHALEAYEFTTENARDLSEFEYDS